MRSGVWVDSMLAGLKAESLKAEPQDVWAERRAAGGQVEIEPPSLLVLFSALGRGHVHPGRGRKDIFQGSAQPLSAALESHLSPGAQSLEPTRLLIL